MSAELALSGRGIENLYRALCRLEEKPQSLTSAEQITSAAIARQDKIAAETLDHFLTILGRVAGDLPLLTMARGGIYIAGGIAAKLAPRFNDGPFLAACQDKAPHSALVTNIGVQVITHPTAGLEGLIAYARAPQLFELEAVVHHRSAAGEPDRA